MAKKQKSGEVIARVKQARLTKHLDEVEQTIRRWITELNAPEPFYWSESEESESFGRLPTTGPRGRSVEEIRLERWKSWACHSVYVPYSEEDADTKHILRRHLRSRALWRYHAEWERALNRIWQLATPLCERAGKMLAEKSGGKQLTEDYKGLALRDAFAFTLGQQPTKTYSQRGTRGVWYDDILIEKTASAEQKDAISQEHWQMMSELGRSKEMVDLAQEWQKTLALQEKIEGLTKKALKSSDFLNPCQFCRRLW